MTSDGGGDPVARNRSFWNGWSDAYEADHGADLAARPLGWGVWGVPESELRALGEVRDRDVLELGCGAARWGIGLTQQGARVVGIDLSERQLAHARRNVAEAAVRLPLVQGSAERAPFRDASFDLVFCDHGATSFTRPERVIPEAARLLRPGGRLVFNMSSPLHDLCWDPETDRAGTRLALDYFGMHCVEDADQVCFQLGYGDWIRLFRRHGLVIEDLIEIRPPADAATSYGDFVSLEWSRRWPAENIWKLRRPGADASS